MIMQDASLFDGTIRDNIDPLQNHSDEQVMAAIEACCLNDLVNSREGLKTKVNCN
jgi:ABC-type multidrug transport system fused ATPase/permease subunit